MRPCREAETNREDERILLRILFPTESFGQPPTSKHERIPVMLNHFLAVMAGLGPGHPRLAYGRSARTAWMPPASAGMTTKGGLTPSERAGSSCGADGGTAAAAVFR